MGLFMKNINEVFGDSPGEGVYYIYFDDPGEKLIILLSFVLLSLLIALLCLLSSVL